MIRVVMHHENYSTNIDVDADEVSILSPGENVYGEDVLVLEKGGKGVAWFRTWSYAIKEEADVTD